MSRKLCPVCTFDPDNDPPHAASCSEASWNAAPKEAHEDDKTTRHEKRRKGFDISDMKE